MTKYKLDEKRDVDTDEGVFILNLPSGFCLDEQDLCHTIGFDSMKELRAYTKHSVVPCDCSGCFPAAKMKTAADYRIDNIRAVNLNGKNVTAFDAWLKQSNAWVYQGAYTAPTRTAIKNLWLIPNESDTGSVRDSDKQ